MTSNWMFALMSSDFSKTHAASRRNSLKNLGRVVTVSSYIFLRFCSLEMKFQKEATYGNCSARFAIWCRDRPRQWVPLSNKTLQNRIQTTYRDLAGTKSLRGFFWVTFVFLFSAEDEAFVASGRLSFGLRAKNVIFSATMSNKCVAFSKKKRLISRVAFPFTLHTQTFSFSHRVLLIACRSFQ